MEPFLEDELDHGMRTFRCFSDSALVRPNFKHHLQIAPDIPPDVSIETVGTTTLLHYEPQLEKLPLGSDIYQKTLAEFIQKPENLPIEDVFVSELFTTPQHSPRRRSPTRNPTCHLTSPTRRITSPTRCPVSPTRRITSPTRCPISVYQCKCLSVSPSGRYPSPLCPPSSPIAGVHIPTHTHSMVNHAKYSSKQPHVPLTSNSRRRTVSYSDVLSGKRPHKNTKPLSRYNSQGSNMFKPIEKQKSFNKNQKSGIATESPEQPKWNNFFKTNIPPAEKPKPILKYRHSYSHLKLHKIPDQDTIIKNISEISKNQLPEYEHVSRNDKTDAFRLPSNQRRGSFRRFRRSLTSAGREFSGYFDKHVNFKNNTLQNVNTCK